MRFIYPTSTLWCVYFALFPPFSLSASPTDVPCTLHIKHDMPSLKNHTISFSFLPITPLIAPPSKYLAKEARYRNHGGPSQRREFLVPTVLLPVKIFPEFLKVLYGIEAVLVIQIRPNLADIPYVCHHTLSELEFEVVLLTLAIYVELRRSY